MLDIQNQIDAGLERAFAKHGYFIRAMTGIKPNNCEVIKFDPRYDILG